MPALVDPVIPAGTFAALTQPTLTASDLTLRPWRGTDAPAVVEAYADPAIEQWHASSMDPDDARSWIAARATRWSAEQGADWAVVDGSGLLGRVGLRVLDLEVGTAEVAYWVMPAARGRGVAGQALETMTTWLFDVVGLHRLSLLHATANVASCRVAEKTGYRAEGTLRSLVLHVDGWHDMHLHARIQGDSVMAAELEDR